MSFSGQETKVNAQDGKLWVCSKNSNSININTQKLLVRRRAGVKLWGALIAKLTHLDFIESH